MTALLCAIHKTDGKFNAVWSEMALRLHFSNGGKTQLHFSNGGKTQLFKCLTNSQSTVDKYILIRTIADWNIRAGEKYGNMHENNASTEKALQAFEDFVTEVKTKL